MPYEWNARKAPRAYLTKFACVILATAVSVCLPVYILIAAMKP
ncbi:hypothetical protein [Neorhizobium sp. DT-125]